MLSQEGPKVAEPRANESVMPNLPRLEFQSSEAEPDLGSKFVVSPDNLITFMGSGSAS